MKKTTIALIAATALLWAVVQDAAAGGHAHPGAPTARLNVAPGPTLATPMPKAMAGIDLVSKSGGSNDHNRAILPPSRPGPPTTIIGAEVGPAVGPGYTPPLPHH